MLYKEGGERREGIVAIKGIGFITVSVIYIDISIQSLVFSIWVNGSSAGNGLPHKYQPWFS